jgi:hypothetical protein
MVFQAGKATNRGVAPQRYRPNPQKHWTVGCPGQYWVLFSFVVPEIRVVAGFGDYSKGFVRLPLVLSKSLLLRDIPALCPNILVVERTAQDQSHGTGR